MKRLCEPPPLPSSSANPVADPRWLLSQAEQRSHIVLGRLEQRFGSEVRLPEPAHAPVREAAYRTWLSERSGMALAALGSAPTRAADLELIGLPDGLARLCVALRRDDGGPDIVLADPFDRGTRWWLEARLREASHPRSRWFVAPASEVHAYWLRLAQEVPLWPANALQRPAAPVLRSPATGAAATPEPAAPADEQLIRQQALRSLREILRAALQEQAQAVQLTSSSAGLHLLARHDGVWRPWSAAPATARDAAALAHEVMIQLRLSANIVIETAQRPQLCTGELTLPHGPQLLHCPVHWFSSVDGSNSATVQLPGPAQPGSLAELGLDWRSAARLHELLARPHGMLVLASPALQGKSTLAHALVRALHEQATAPARSILLLQAQPPLRVSSMAAPQDQHAEDDTPLTPWLCSLPLPGASDDGARLRDLDAALRMRNPDTVVIDEISDPHWARWALDQALAGRRVLLTLAASNASSALQRLKQLCGPEAAPALAQALSGVHAQRLLRQVCPHCAGPDSPDLETLERSGLSAQSLDDGWMFARGTGCALCHGSGYQGVGAIVQQLGRQAAARELLGLDNTAAARPADGDTLASVPSLRAAALDRVASGLVPLEEANRVTAVDE